MNDEMPDQDALFHQEMQAIVGRRIRRDMEFLRMPKRAFFRGLADDTREWVTQETKDTTIIIEWLKSHDDQSVNFVVEPIEKRVAEIRKTYMRKVIAPIRKAEKSKVRDEAEHWLKFRQVLEPTVDLVLELWSMRRILEALVTRAVGVEAARKYRPPGFA